MWDKCSHTMTGINASGLPHSLVSSASRRLSPNLSDKISFPPGIRPACAALVRPVSHTLRLVLYPSGLMACCDRKSEYREGSRTLNYPTQPIRSFKSLWHFQYLLKFSSCWSRKLRSSLIVCGNASTSNCHRTTRCLVGRLVSFIRQPWPVDLD